ncbi:restriction endonuclease subunit S [Streptococcus rubneri]|jgi:type I restriction-modification system specificity subunit|uniref:Restriction endonuclease subunit S n=1 Tax=Streptococcus rubneri TaxID=1234680 RepID=A0A4Z1DVV3_9STRE|nr:restriction endonuclease subunit S [Streptococcus rubneri]MBK4774370.1 restriction endonuclease subunit S [Streptococcus rubneri]TGN92197.1 restriction endonuclease subunit S [Streptococcus rubneri]
MEEKILPILRFDNFNDYWRTSSLLSQVEVRRGLTYNPNDVRSKGARVLRSSNIVDDSFVISDDDVFVSKDVINIPRVSNGDILVTAANGSTKLVGKHAIIKNLPDDEIVVHGGFMLLFKTEQNYFVNAWMSSNEYKRVLQFVQGGNGAIGNLSSVILKSMKMSVPSFSEQSAIGSLFSTFDDLLARYKDNLTNYQSLKETMLAKMFPKAGQTVPEIRLDGFEGEWKERTLGSLGSVAMNKRIFKNETSVNGDIPFYKIGTFGGTADAFISKEKFKEYKEKYPYPEIGDILISASGSIGRTVVYNGEAAYYQDSNIVWLKHDQQLDNSYLKQYYGIIKWSGIEGTTIKRLYNKNILETNIFLPPNVAEQQAIGAYFSNLDNLINSHQEKISQLETLKKKLLKDMFV